MLAKAGSIFRYFFLDLLGSVVRWPLWWYGGGFLDVLRWSRRGLVYRWQSYGVTVWLKNFFVPMYGTRDWSGRLISVFMRLVVLIARLVSIAVEAVLHVVLWLVWLAAPPVFFVLFIYSFYRGAFVEQVRNLLP